MIFQKYLRCTCYFCATNLCVKELYEQFQLGDKSFHAPYVKYLMNQPRGRIISEWSDEGKDFLSEMLNKYWDEDEELWKGGLPPKFVKSYEEVWLGWCKGEDNEIAKAAFYQFTSRDEDTLMVRPFCRYLGGFSMIIIAYLQMQLYRSHFTTCTIIAMIQKS